MKDLEHADWADRQAGEAARAEDYAGEAEWTYLANKIRRNLLAAIVLATGIGVLLGTLS